MTDLLRRRTSPLHALLFAGLLATLATPAAIAAADLSATTVRQSQLISIHATKFSPHRAGLSDGPSTPLSGDEPATVTLLLIGLGLLALSTRRQQTEKFSQ